MRTAKSFNKKTGITYVYEILDSYYDKEKKMSVSKRRLIGKIDPETNELIPTRPRGKNKSAPVEEPKDFESLYLKTKRELDARDKEFEKFRKDVSSALDDLTTALNEIEKSAKTVKVKLEMVRKRMD